MTRSARSIILAFEALLNPPDVMAWLGLCLHHETTSCVTQVWGLRYPSRGGVFR